MAIQIQTQSDLPVKFKLGAALLDDPAPSSTLSRKHELLCRNFPQLRFTSIFQADGIVENGFMVYTIMLPPPKVNG